MPDRRVSSSSSIPSVITGGSIFSFGGKFRYSGRVEKEVLEDSARDDQPSIVRSNSLRVKASSVPDTPMTPITNDIDSCIMQPGNLDHAGFVGEEFLVGDMCDNSSNVISSHDLRGSLSEYYFHESLGHSYSESQLTRMGQRLSKMSKPIPFLPSSVKLPIPSSSFPSVPVPVQLPPALPQDDSPPTKFHFMKVFWPSFIAAAMVVVAFIVILLETDAEALSPIRQMPEMVTLRVQYYEQIKQYFKL